MKRFLKWTAAVIAVIILVPIIALLMLVGAYKHIVHQTPGALKTTAAPGNLGSYVNPFNGTGGFPYMSPLNTPAATTPFGMIRLGPDTASLLINKNGLNRSGYYYGDNKILGFSHNRLVGADSLEGGSFRILPTVADRVNKVFPKDNRFARFNHTDENGFPGYYAVRLPKDRILAELTATTRVGAHRYTFETKTAPHLLLDVTSHFGDKRCENGVVQILPDAREVEGSVRAFGSFSGRYDGLDIYFVARFSQPFAQYATWTGDTLNQGATGVAGNDIGVDLEFAEKDAGQVIEVRLALSYVSMNNARLNLDAETQGKQFDDLLAGAKEAWEKQLSPILVQGGTDTQKRIFYTALYRAFQMPTIFNDVNNEYIGFDRAIHKADGFRYYTDFSLWDTFRTVHPLYCLAARNEHQDMMISLLEMSKAGGAFPRWPSGCGYTNCMFGTPADVAVSEAYLKGIRGFDIEAAYQSMRQVALEGPPPGSRFGGREGMPAYLSLGYCPSDRFGDSVSATLEQSWSDHALSLLAAALGKTADAELFSKHAKFYQNLWNPATQFFQAKDSFGNFDPNFKPLLLSYADFDRKYTKAYVEGSAMQWRWSVPYDPEGLIALFSSKEYFISELEKYMAGAKPGPGGWNPGGNYWHGNEPYIHAAYLFNDAGRPDLAQKWARWIMDNEYANDYVGLDGNDDGGTLSSWYVFSALGFYPVAGTTKYWLGSPLFSRADIRFDDIHFTITAENTGPQNYYVQKAWLNDKPLDHPWFFHEDIAKGGTLKFLMGPTPSLTLK